MNCAPDCASKTRVGLSRVLKSTHPPRDTVTPVLLQPALFLSAPVPQAIVTVAHHPIDLFHLAWSVFGVAKKLTTCAGCPIKVAVDSTPCRGSIASELRPLDKVSFFDVQVGVD